MRRPPAEAHGSDDVAVPPRVFEYTIAHRGSQVQHGGEEGGGVETFAVHDPHIDQGVAHFLGPNVLYRHHADPGMPERQRHSRHTQPMFGRPGRPIRAGSDVHLVTIVHVPPVVRGELNHKTWPARVHDEGVAVATRRVGG